jgi:hypothetical protein
MAMPIESYPSTRAMPSFPGTNLSLIDGGTLYGTIVTKISVFDPDLYTFPCDGILVSVEDRDWIRVKAFQNGPRKENRALVCILIVRLGKFIN